MKNVQSQQFRAKTSQKKEDFNVKTFDNGKPLQRRRLSAGKSKLPASLTPQMQSLNRTQQFLTTIHSKKASIAQATVDQQEPQSKQEETKAVVEPQIENIIQYEEQPDHDGDEEEELFEVVH